MSKLLIPSKNISKLDLSNQNLKSIPKEVFALKNLKTLDLSNNNISIIPSDIIKLKRLEILDASNNKISNFYAKICALSKLRVLNLNNNSIKTIPKQIIGLSRLKVFSIANNKLNDLPQEIGQLNSLEKLNLSKNPMIFFPEILFNLCSLKALWINNIPLQSFPINKIVLNIANLKYLYCYKNNFQDISLNSDYLFLSKIKGNCFPCLKKLANSQTKKIDVSIESDEKESKKTKIFISYAHSGPDWLKKVKIHLKGLQFNSNNNFEVWEDTRIDSGGKWKRVIDQELETCKIAILLISAEFLASDFIRSNELPLLLRKAEKDGTVILPLILDHCLFTSDINLKYFQAVNDPEKPLNACTKSDAEKWLVKLAKDVEKHLA